MTERATSGPMESPPINRTMITISIMLATVIQALDGTIANVALPHMQGSLSASSDQITWVLTSFIVAAAIATPLNGWLVDRYGLKKVFLASVAGFTLASVLCGISATLTEIVIARMLQGVFGAALVPLSQAVLLDINPREKHGSAMAIWGMGVMIGPILGPTLGGWLTDQYDWRWVFFINVPIGALQIMLDRGEQNDWFGSTETWVEAIMLALSAAYFIAHTATRPAGQSFIDYRLLLNSNYVTGLLLIFIVGMGLVFVPLSAATFATLSPQMRAEGTALYSLIRNIGSSIGIALVQTLLVRNTQIAHASLTEHINIANPALGDPATALAGTGAAAINAEISRQASMIAYVDDYWLMMILTCAVIPALILIRPPKRSAGPVAVDHAALE